MSILQRTFSQIPRLNTKIIATIPIFIAVNLAALCIWHFDISAQSMPLILGIIAGGLVDQDNRLTGRLKNLFFTLLAFSASSLLVRLFINDSVLFIALMGLLTFSFTMLGALGQRYNTIAFGALVVAVYTILTYFPSGQAWYLDCLLILAGTLLYSVITLCVHLLFPYRPVQENIAKAFSALSAYLQAKADFFDPDDIAQLEQKQIHLALQNSQVIQAFNLCRHALFYRIRGQHRHTRTSKLLRYYFAAQDIHERANSSHFNYQKLAQELQNSDLIFRIQRLLELQAQAALALANSLQHNQTYHYNPRLAQAITAIHHSLDWFAKQSPNSENLTNLRSLIENLQNVDWQLRALDQNQNLAQTHRTHENEKIHTDQISGWRNIVRAIKSQLNFRSQLFRHAVRLTLVVLVCCCLVESLQLERGYWILLTAVFVCQPNYSATKLRLKQRIIGTLLGVLVGSLLPYFAQTLEAKFGIVVLSSTLFYFFRSNNYSFSTFFITIQVLISFNIMGFAIESALLPRMLDTLIGTFIAWFGVSYLWPDWKYLQLDGVIRQALHSNAQYLRCIVAQLQFGKGDALKYRIIRRNAQDQAAALGNTLANMNSEPKKYAAHLARAFTLLKLNNTLLSYISALGAYRSAMQQQHQSCRFLSEFYPASKQLVQLIEQLATIDAESYTQIQLKLEQQLKTAQPNVPIQQLQMINELLPAIYQELNR